MNSPKPCVKAIFRGNLQTPFKEKICQNKTASHLKAFSKGHCSNHSYISNEGSENGDVFLDTTSPKVGFGSAFPKTFEIGALFNSPFLRSEHSHTMGNMFPSARCFGGLLSCGLTGKAH